MKLVFSRFECCAHSIESWTDVYQTFSKYRAGYVLHNNVFKLRRLAQGTLL